MPILVKLEDYKLYRDILPCPISAINHIISGI